MANSVEHYTNGVISPGGRSLLPPYLSRDGKTTFTWCFVSNGKLRSSRHMNNPDPYRPVTPKVLNYSKILSIIGRQYSLEDQIPRYLDIPELYK